MFMFKKFTLIKIFIEVIKSVLEKSYSPSEYERNSEKYHLAGSRNENRTRICANWEKVIPSFEQQMISEPDREKNIDL